MTNKTKHGFIRSLQSGVYTLQVNGSAHTYPVYCHMHEIPGCGTGGWTLVMKTDGDAVSYVTTFPL